MNTSLQNTETMVLHAELLVRLFNVALEKKTNVQILPNITWKHASCTKGMTTYISIPAITCRENYIAAMHEIGHIHGPWQSITENCVLEQEGGAWKWARENIEDWCEQDGIMRRICLESYLTVQEDAKKKGYRRHPANGLQLFPEPEKDHYVWKCLEDMMA